MSYQIDARGKSCPVPVLMAKKEVDNGREDFSVIVDNQTSVENLKRFGSNSGYETAVNEKGSEFEISFVKSQNICDSAQTPENGTWAVFIGKERIGEGDPELGESLMKMFFYTLTQDNNIPRCILFMNSGVKIPVENEQAVEHLKALNEKGTEILICGTCLNYYEIADKLQVGTISNMYDIVDAMRTVNKVITI